MRLRQQEMHKIILDTNVIISALISRSFPNLILSELVLKRKVALCLSNEILLEYRNVINRDKFNKYPNFLFNANIVLNNLKEFSTFYSINYEVDILKDKDDNKFLELAFESKADYLITGNYLDFNIENFYDTKIVSPSQYWELNQ